MTKHLTATEIKKREQQFLERLSMGHQLIMRSHELEVARILQKMLQEKHIIENARMINYEKRKI